MAKKRRIPVNFSGNKENGLEGNGGQQPVDSAEQNAGSPEDEQKQPAEEAESRVREGGAGGDTAEPAEAQIEPEDRDADFSLLDESQELPSINRESEGVAAELVQVRKELEETHDKYLRSLADLENYRKRVLKERSELLKYQGEKVLYDFLQVVDDFERAVSHLDADPEQIKAGVNLIYKNFLAVLEKWGVRGETTVGSLFDPAKHAAISKVPVDDAIPGTIINELKKAYFYKDKLLRPAEVVVAAAPRREESVEVKEQEKDTHDSASANSEQESGGAEEAGEAADDGSDDSSEQKR